MNIISIGGADAVTIDGANWTRYLHHTFDYPADDPQRFLKLKYPMFALATGAKRTASGMPLIASYHCNEIQAIGHVLLDAVKQHCDQCPFAFNDNDELWCWIFYATHNARHSNKPH